VSTDVRAETVVARPRDEVAAYAMDHRHDPVWIGGIREARLVGDAPFGVGSRVERVAGFLGRRIEYVLEVTALDPGSRIVMSSVKAPFPMTVTYEFADADGGTRASVRVQGDASGFYGRLTGPLLSPMVRRNITGDVRRLKRVLEEG
jgi:uncharacterized protein YndB with AHSA1/START domain